MKIAIIGDIHLGLSRDSTSHPGVVRQANSQAETTLNKVISQLNSLQLDLLVHLGDALRDVHIKETDTQNLSTTLSLLDQIQCPKIHLIGNHELAAFSLSEIEAIYTENSIPPKFFGVQEFDSIRVIWLDMTIDKNTGVSISSERLAWLHSLPASAKHTLVFTHYSLIPIDNSGSFYFEKDPKGMYVNNSQQVLDALVHLNPSICVNGHVHLLTQQIKESIQFISAPSFSENIAAEKFTENNPGIFSILDFSKNAFVFTSYSGDYCFGKIQGNF